MCVCVCVRMDHMSDDAGKTQASCAHTRSSLVLLLLLLSRFVSHPSEAWAGGQRSSTEPLTLLPLSPPAPPSLTLHPFQPLDHFHPPTYSHDHPFRLTTPQHLLSRACPPHPISLRVKTPPHLPRNPRSNCFMTSQSSTRHCSQVS